MMTRTFGVVCGLGLLAGCPLDPKNIGEPEVGSDESDASGVEGSDTTGPVDLTSTGSAEASTGPAGTSEGTGEGMGDETAWEGAPPECNEVDPAVSAAFTLELPDWPHGDAEDFEYDVQCDVDAVSAVGGEVETALSCDLALVAVLRIPVAPEGDVAWAVDDLVRLVITNNIDLGLSTVRAVEMRRLDDDELLVSAVNSNFDGGYESRFAPLIVEQQFPCGIPEAPVPTRMDFFRSESEGIEVFSGHRGWLAMTSDEGYAIDVEAAIAEEFHFGAPIKIVARRIRTP